jgi:hypothetical protein
MSRVGDEQKIRMLFLELRLEQQSPTPHFATMWHRAQLRTLHSRGSWNKSLVAVCCVVVLTVSSVVFWMTRLQPDSLDLAAISIPQLWQGPPRPSRLSIEGSSSTKSRHHLSESRLRISMTGSKKIRTRTPRDQDRLMASGWESPTDYLLRSPAEEILMSIPDVDPTNRRSSVSGAN